MDALLEWADSLGAVFSGGGAKQSRKVGRIIVAFIALLNLSIFYTNLRWMMKSAESMSGPAGMPIDVRPSGYGRGVATFVGKLFMGKEVESRKFNIDPSTGEFVPIKDTRIKPDKYFVSHPVVVSSVTSTTMSAVRQLVGSIHFWHPELAVWLYEIGSLTDRHRSEIHLWEDTKLLDGMDVLRAILMDQNLTLDKGPIGELQRELRERMEDGAFDPLDEENDGELPPTTEVSLRKLLLGGRLAMGPAVMWHALKRNPVIMYLDHTSHTRGWIDNVLKALVRDGRFFVQEETTKGGCNPVVQGYAARSNLTERLLRRHLICAMGGACPSEELGSLRPDERPDLHNWWGLRPDAIDGETCHDASSSKVSTEDSLRQLAVRKKGRESPGRGWNVGLLFFFLFRIHIILFSFFSNALLARVCVTRASLVRRRTVTRWRGRRLGSSITVGFGVNRCLPRLCFSPS